MTFHCYVYTTACYGLRITFVLCMLCHAIRSHKIVVYVEPGVYDNLSHFSSAADSARADGCQPQQHPQQSSSVYCNVTTGNAGDVIRASVSNGTIRTWQPSDEDENADFIPEDVANQLDLVVVLGGDGTVLWTCHIFGNRAVPPLVPFNLGSLGFLTPFQPHYVCKVLARTLAGEGVGAACFRHVASACV